MVQKALIRSMSAIFMPNIQCLHTDIRAKKTVFRSKWSHWQYKSHSRKDMRHHRLEKYIKREYSPANASIPILTINIRALTSTPETKVDKFQENCAHGRFNIHQDAKGWSQFWSNIPITVEKLPSISIKRY